MDDERVERPRFGSYPAYYSVVVRELSHWRRLLSSVAERTYGKYLAVRKMVALQLSHVIERDTLLEDSSISNQFGREKLAVFRIRFGRLEIEHPLFDRGFNDF